MAVTIKENKTLRERIYINTLSSGVKCYIIPKYGYCEKQAIVAVKYGSNDTKFRPKGKKEIVDSPKGVAHFLEHKLFEEEWGNVFDIFTKYGATANAFTDSNKTAYYFSCKEHFDENFKTLLQFVQSPYFTQESTQREKSIIGQEITMYDDDPYWQVYFNMLKAMFFQHGVREGIAGTIESIENITKDTLYECYENFYCPDNMTIVCIGDFEPDHIFDMVRDLVRIRRQKRAETIYDTEKEEVKESYIESKMEVSRPVFQIGYKEKPMKAVLPDKVYGMRMLLDLLAGESSPLYSRLYEKGLLDDTIGLQYVAGPGFSVPVFAGSSPEPESVFEELKREIGYRKEHGFEREAFERIRKKHVGRFIRGFNSVNAICMSQLDNALKGFDLLDAFLSVKNMTRDTVEGLLNEEFREERAVLSVVKKKD